MTLGPRRLLALDAVHSAHEATWPTIHLGLPAVLRLVVVRAQAAAAHERRRAEGAQLEVTAGKRPGHRRRLSAHLSTDDAWRNTAAESGVLSDGIRVRSMM